ncbi:phytanoyl-CoA dioxygenase family protein [Rickettsia tamurae]|uniref:Phytanoyl-CoA dioxygenase (PhyH) n=1 Tax=Rickettsia tamurae subsp. buchneri TaxID=1462938 RepID=A0A8E0WKB1_9RICK|nr:phytanoyl-CoA dioxygenase family protein [Rickettsia tamurae]KDO02171.1 Phytanoyl-CoA dioxygenase (PhyH) [Rickettsia tamurae subsp. buchneri]
MEKLQDDGFFIIKNLISLDLVTWHLNDIKNKIAGSAEEFGISVSDYLNCTGRWVAPSQVTRTISDLLNDIIKDKLEKLLQCQIVNKKSNVICKTADLVDAVPFHQDISYNPDNPYHFSVWLALNDVYEASGALQIIKNSHNWKIKPAVDFWSPYFIDKYSNKLTNQQTITLPISAGEAIVFNSKLWHGSGENLNAKDRFAYVTRWVIKDKEFPVIPKPKPLVFGMFNCGSLTEEILKKSLLYFNKYHDIKENSKEELIKTWLSYLENNSDISEIDIIKASKDLSKLLILNQAATLHNAGDIAGKIHRNLWFSLLNFLNAKVQVVKI